MLGLIGAMDVEVKDLIESLTDKKEINILYNKFYTGKINNNDVVILKCGVGKVQSAIGCALMIENFKPSLIINTGIAGGTNGLKQYDVVVAKEVSYSDVDATGFGYKLGQVPGLPEVYYTDDESRNKIKVILNELNIKFVEGSVLSDDLFITYYDKLLDLIVSQTIKEFGGKHKDSLLHTLKEWYEKQSDNAKNGLRLTKSVSV